MWKCKNPECGRTFPMLGRISTEKRMPPAGFSPSGPDRTIVEKPCCPFCESLEFEEIKEESNIEWVRADEVNPSDIVPRKKKLV